MSTIKEIVSFLEQGAPLRYQEDYDNCGLLTGDDNSEVKGVLVSLDCTEQVIDEAIQKGSNLVVSHHPVIFQGLKQLTGNNYAERVVIKAIKNDIALYAIHTNLDNVHDGVNAMICEKLGLKKCKVLSPKAGLLSKLVTFCPGNHVSEVRQAIFDAGAGVIGNYDECSFNISGTGTFRGNQESTPFVGEKGKLHQEEEIRVETIFPSHLREKIVSALLKAHPYEEAAYDIYPLANSHPRIGAGMIGELEKETDEMTFLKRVKEIMKSGAIRYTALTGKSVKKIAVCGGSGSFLLKEAIRSGAQVFITSDFKYHQFFDAEGKIVIADIGHYESEQFTKELIYRILKKNFSTFAIHISGTDTNPVKYL